MLAKFQIIYWGSNIHQKRDLLEPEKYTPRDYQKRILNEINNGFMKNDRGKAIAACGTGKTLVALWSVEKINSNLTLFVAPNLALIKQTLDEWLKHSTFNFDFLNVCSDETVAKDAINNDNFAVNIDVPVTTNPFYIHKFLNNSSPNKKIIFSTYQSLGAIVNAMNEVNFSFDIAIFDEAHRTAGNKNSEMFTSFAFDNKYIPIKKRLFLTATERTVNKIISEKAKDYDYEIFSMDNEEQYGKTFSTYSFGDAIKDKVISDYKIVLSFMSEEEIPKEILENRISQIEVNDVEKRESALNNLIKQIILGKTINELNINKVVTYHSYVKDAKAFINGDDVNLPLRDVFNHQFSFNDDDLYLGHINGADNAQKRKKIFDDFVNSSISVLSNAKCLTEGVNIPVIDAVFFADPKSSTIDIVQAIGRALRISNLKQEYSYIIIPVIIPANTKNFTGLNSDLFDSLYNVVLSLRDQDKRLLDEINELNRMKATTKRVPKQPRSLPILTLATPNINIEALDELIELRISQVNDNLVNEDIRLMFEKSKNSRQSAYTRLVKSIGDYSIESYKSLVLKTIKKFNIESEVQTSDNLKIDNNNLSHTKRLGIIYEVSKNAYKLTNIGKVLYSDNTKFISIIHEQMFKYSTVYNSINLKLATPSDEHFKTIFMNGEKEIIHPYRLLLKLLLEFDEITIIEFIYGFYIIKSDIDIEACILRIKSLRETYPNIHLLNDENKLKDLETVNTLYKVNFTFKDIWTSSTTVYNQYTYFAGHLISMGVCNKISTPIKKIVINDYLYYKGDTIKTKSFISDLLNKTSKIENFSYEGNYDSYMNDYHNYLDLF